VQLKVWKPGGTGCFLPHLCCDHTIPFPGIFVSNFLYWFFAVYIVIHTSGQKILITTQDPQKRSLQDQPQWPRVVKWHFHHRKMRAHRCKFVFWLKALWSQERWRMQLKVWKPGGAGRFLPDLSWFYKVGQLTCQLHMRFRQANISTGSAPHRKELSYQSLFYMFEYS
jgi:hypothetical protein